MIGLVIVLILGLFSFSIFNIFSLKREQHDAEAQKRELIEEKEQLEKELEEVNDISNVEEQARDQLRLIKPGETIFLFPDSITNSDDSDDDSESDDSSDQQKQKTFLSGQREVYFYPDYTGTSDCLRCTIHCTCI